MSSLNSTPSAERTHIGIFGRRNSGKSSLINALTGQSLAIVSDVLGTTTDPVSKAMEILPLGPVVIIDTPGLDDEGELGKLRVEKAYGALNKSDIAILVVDGTVGMTSADKDIMKTIKAKNIPYIVVINKLDEITSAVTPAEDEIYVSAKTNENIKELKDRLAVLVPQKQAEFPIISDKVCRG